MQRYSKQREIILNNLKNRCDHPTAEMIYMDVKKDIPKISLGTVYRNLNGLLEDNSILCFTIDGKDHFDGNAKPHIHLQCTCCGLIMDKMIDEDVKSSFEPELYDISNIIIQGRCQKCMSAAKTSL